MQLVFFLGAQHTSPVPRRTILDYWEKDLQSSNDCCKYPVLVIDEASLGYLNLCTGPVNDNNQPHQDTTGCMLPMLPLEGRMVANCCPRVVRTGRLLRQNLALLDIPQRRPTS